MKKTILLGFGLFCMAVQGNVWDDCVARYAGRTDGEATGLFAKGGLLDVRHSANTSGATMANVQDWLALYGGRQILFRQESVQCATLGKTLENQTVLYFPHPAVTNTDESVVCKHSPLYFPLANFLQGDGITFLLRFRLDAEQFLKTDGAFDFVCPLICDYDWGAQQGWKIWIKASGSTDNEVYFCNGKRMNDYTAHTGLRITNTVWTARGEAWTELAVVVKDATHARIGLGQPGCVFKWADVACDSLTTSLLPRENYNIYMGASSYTGDSAPSQEAARMSVHLLAAWNRALSDREVYEALGDPNPGVFRIGCAGAAADMFTGDGTADVTVDCGAQDVRDVPAVLPQGRSVSFLFTPDAFHAERAQLFRVTPAADSPTGQAEILLDGAPLATKIVLPARTLSIFVPGEKLTAAAHTFAVKSLSGDLKFDSFALTGSRQWGTHGQKWNDKSSVTAALADFYAEDGNFKDLSYETWPSRSQNLHLTLPEDVAQRNPIKYTTYVADFGGVSALTLFVNGLEKQTFDMTKLSKGTKLEIDFEAEDLAAGDNVFRWAIDAGWLIFDDHVLEVGRAKNIFNIMIK